MHRAACASRERDERGMTNRPGSAMEWRYGRPAAPSGAAWMLAACSPPGRWRRWRQATANDGEARRQGPSGRRERQEQPRTRRGRSVRLPWRR